MTVTACQVIKERCVNQLTQSRDVHELVVPETLYTILQKLMNVSRVPVKTVVTVQT